jgi:hypothetical protein
MAFDRDTLEQILATTGGACHRCRQPLTLSHHGQLDLPGAWGLDVVRPHPKSTVLLPACVACLRPAASASPRTRERAPGDLSSGTGVTLPVFIGYARPRATPTDQS